MRVKTIKKIKKILEISGYPPPRSGWNVRVLYLKKAIERNGHICKVLNISPFSRKIPSTEYIRTLNGLDYVCKLLYFRLIGYKFHMHLNGDSPKGFILTILAEIISLITFRRATITFHAGPFQKFFPRESAPLLIPVFKFIFRCADKIICNDINVKEKIIEYGIRENKIHTIPAFSKQYLDFKYVRLNEKIQHFIETREPIIGVYVFFRPEFFIDHLILGISKLIKYYPKLGLVIIGDEKGAGETKKLIQKLNINHNVYFAGDQPHSHFLTIISKCDVYLRTPIKDGVSSSVLEVLSLGIPVVASENHRRPESVITYKNEDVENFVQVLKKVVQNLHEIKKNIIKPNIVDTVSKEVNLLLE